jgi:hypothetical protein
VYIAGNHRPHAARRDPRGVPSISEVAARDQVVERGAIAANVRRVMDAGSWSSGARCSRTITCSGSASDGGRQSPLTHVQPGPGCTVVQLDPLPVPGGSQLPFTHTQSAPGCTVVQPPGPGSGATSAGSQAPFTQTQFDPGWTVVQPPLVLPPPPPGARSGGTQSPLTQTQFDTGWTVVHPELLVLPPPPGARSGGSQLPFTQTQFDIG